MRVVVFVAIVAAATGIHAGGKQSAEIYVRAVEDAQHQLVITKGDGGQITLPSIFDEELNALAQLAYLREQLHGQPHPVYDLIDIATGAMLMEFSPEISPAATRPDWVIAVAKR